MRILGIETSCDETAAAIVKDGTKILSNVVATSAEMHVKTGGIIPEQAARQQILSMIPVIKTTMQDAKCQITNIDAIAVTAGGPGLIGSMLVGVETAKTLAWLWNKPIIPVVHLLAHVYANWLMGSPYPEFPSVILTVAGGHTDLILMEGHGNFEWIGGTRDDAAGETFDKVARLIGLPYPGGPSIQKLAIEGNPLNIKLPRPLLESNDFDFSFSGLKTAVLREMGNNKNLNKADLAASFQMVVAEILTTKAVNASRKYKAKNLLVAGGVAANDKLRNLLRDKSPIPVFIPPVNLCTDNATFIASFANFNFHPMPWYKIEAIPDPFEGIEKYANN